MFISLLSNAWHLFTFFFVIAFIATGKLLSYKEVTHELVSIRSVQIIIPLFYVLYKRKQKLHDLLILRDISHIRQQQFDQFY